MRKTKLFVEVKEVTDLEGNRRSGPPYEGIRSRNSSGILISTFAIVVAISISFVSAGARKAHSFRCSSSPTKARIALVGSLSGHHFLRQHFDIHSPAFHILYRGNLKSAILAN